MKISPEDCYAAWAPDGAVWSRWAKPVLFTQVDKVTDEAVSLPQIEPLVQPPRADGGTAIVVDLPGMHSLTAGMALARSGFRPVPLYNATWGARPAVDIGDLVRSLRAGADFLTRTSLSADAPPAFLIDAARQSRLGGPGDYDNRWVVMPQDFPSATFLLSRRIREVLVIQRDSAPAQDLAHVLRRWQEAGIRISRLEPGTGHAPEPLDVPKPSAFRLAWYGLIALFGLRRSNVGGFGGYIPEQTSSGGIFRGGGFS